MKLRLLLALCAASLLRADGGQEVGRGRLHSVKIAHFDPRKADRRAGCLSDFRPSRLEARHAGT